MHENTCPRVLPQHVPNEASRIPNDAKTILLQQLCLVWCIMKRHAAILDSFRLVWWRPSLRLHGAIQHMRNTQRLDARPVSCICHGTNVQPWPNQVCPEAMHSSSEVFVAVTIELRNPLLVLGACSSKTLRPTFSSTVCFTDRFCWLLHGWLLPLTAIELPALIAGIPMNGSKIQLRNRWRPHGYH